MSDATDARDRALDRVAAAADQRWASAATMAVRALAESREAFTTDAVWALLLRMGASIPDEPRALGAVMRRCRDVGWIEPTDRTVLSSRPETHARPIRVWRSRLSN